MASVVIGTLQVAEPRGPSEVASTRAPAAARIEATVRAYYSVVWRSLRRLGIAEHAADDAAQQVFSVFARRVDDVALGKEKTFLFGVAIRVAQSMRKRDARVDASGDDALASIPCAGSNPEQLLDAHRARAVLDALLDAMPDDLRTVFVLHEIEEMTMAEIASVTTLPPGTVASRLRRSRALFEELSLRAQRRGLKGHP